MSKSIFTTSVHRAAFIFDNIIYVNCFKLLYLLQFININTNIEDMVVDLYANETLILLLTT